MTPPAATAAARRAAPVRHAAPVRRAAVAVPRPQRRVSGPARPARPTAVPRRRPARAAELPAGARLLAWLRTLPDHRLLDRLIHGRVWIVLIGGLLVGLVTVQLTLLRLNAGIGQAVARTTQLEQRNAALRTTVSRLSDSAQIVARATQMGYVTPPQGSPRFLTASAADAAKALTTMRVPSPVATIPAATTAPVTDTTVTDPTAATTAPVTTTDSAATTDPATATTTPVTTADPASATTPAAAAPTSTSTPTTAATTAAGGAVAPQG